MNYDSTSLDGELRAAALPIVGCASDGRIDWASLPTPAQLAAAQSVLAAHDPMKRMTADANAATTGRAALVRLRSTPAPTITDIRDVLLWITRGM